MDRIRGSRKPEVGSHRPATLYIGVNLREFGETLVIPCSRAPMLPCPGIPRRSKVAEKQKDGGLLGNLVVPGKMLPLFPSRVTMMAVILVGAVVVGKTWREM